MSAPVKNADIETTPPPRHPGAGRDLAGASGREVEIPAFAGMTEVLQFSFVHRPFSPLTTSVVAS
jgi:hypothetical protein